LYHRLDEKELLSATQQHVSRKLEKINIQKDTNKSIGVYSSKENDIKLI